MMLKVLARFGINLVALYQVFFQYRMGMMRKITLVVSLVLNEMD